MAATNFTIIQAGTSLQMVDGNGNLATLTLPATATLRTDRPPRFAVFGRYVVLVNTPNRPLTIDPNGAVRFLTPRPPGQQIALSGAGSSTLSGTYTVKQTFRLLDKDGNVIAESDFGPASAAATIASQFLKATNIELSTDLTNMAQPTDVMQQVLYRTTTLGTTYFPWVTIDGNQQTQIQDDQSDAGLGSIPAEVRGSAPDLIHIAEWRGRLWGVDRTDFDYIRWTEAGEMYAWAADNSLLVPRLGADSRGVMGLISRKESLGIGRRNALRQVTGTTNDDFRVVNLTENVGIESQETVCTYNDAAFWLWKDGVYRWDASGITCVSDGVGGKGAVRSWFTTNSYFNRQAFVNAFAILIPERHVYRLFLASAGQSTIDRFVDFDFAEGIWYGPHKTGAWTLVSGIQRPDTQDTPIPTIGVSTGFLVQEQDTRTDGTATAIDFSVDSKKHDGGSPNVDKVFERLQVASVPLSTGSLIITPSVGELDAPVATQALRADLRIGSQVVGRVSVAGRSAKVVTLNFREATAGQDVKLLGYELPFHELGQR